MCEKTIHLLKPDKEKKKKKVKSSQRLEYQGKLLLGYQVGFALSRTSRTVRLAYSPRHYFSFAIKPFIPYGSCQKTQEKGLGYFQYCNLKTQHIIGDQ